MPLALLPCIKFQGLRLVSPVQTGVFEVDIG